MVGVTAKQAARIVLAAELQGLGEDPPGALLFGRRVRLFYYARWRCVFWPGPLGINEFEYLKDPHGFGGPFNSRNISINGALGGLEYRPVAMLAAGVMLGPHRKVDEMVTPIMFVRQLQAWMTTHSRSSKLPTDVDLTTITVAAARRAAEHTGRAAGQWLRAEAALVALEP